MIGKMNNLMRLQAKSLIFNAVLVDIYFTALEKLYMIRRAPLIPASKKELSEGERLAHLHYNLKVPVKDLARDIGKPAKDVWSRISHHKKKVTENPPLPIKR